MAFISMVFVFIFMLLCAGGFIGLILLIIGLILKSKNKKKEKKSKAPIVLSVIGIVLMLPIVLLLLLALITGTYSSIKNRGNICYQVKNGQVEDVKRLLDKGTAPDCKRDSYDENIVAEDGEYTILAYLCYSQNVPDNVEKIQLLIDYGANVNYVTHWCDYTPEEHLSDAYDQDRGYSDSCGETPLMIACQWGNYEAAKILLENGADVNAKDYCGEDALIYAANPSGNGISDETQMKIGKLLIEYGIDTDTCGKYSGTAIECARMRGLGGLVGVIGE